MTLFQIVFILGSRVSLGVASIWDVAGLMSKTK